MGYLNEDGLARYDGLVKNWVTFKSGTVDGIDPLLNWQKTDAAGVVTFYPLPAAPIDPVVNFAFTETGPASGTKSPDNPSTISGVSEVKVTRCGKNLLNMAGFSGFTQYGVTFVVDSNAGTVTVTSDGPATADATFYVAIWPNMKMYANQQYFLSGCPAGGSATTYYLGGSFYSEDGVYGGGMSSDFGSGALLSKEFNWRYNCIIRIRAGVTVSNLVFKPQLELGSAATSFEPYDGADYTVNLGGTYYGGSVDLSAGTMTVTWWGHVFDGTEAMNLAYTYEDVSMIATSLSGTTPIPATIATTTDNVAFCTHYPHLHDWGNHVGFAVHPNGIIRFFTPLTIASTAAELQAFFASQYTNGTPVVLTYPVLTPTTVSLTPLQIYSLSQPDPYTPRLNTVYSDQTSVQVGYPKSPQATASELTNAIISLGSNL